VLHIFWWILDFYTQHHLLFSVILIIAWSSRVVDKLGQHEIPHADSQSGREREYASV
jgi:hypothetical protein